MTSLRHPSGAWNVRNRPDVTRAVAICVPVRNEEAALPALLAGLEVQDAPSRMDVTLCFNLDHCKDASEHIVRQHARTSRWPVRMVRSDSDPAPNAGKARARAMALGLEALGLGDHGHLLTTDADSVPAPDWLAQMDVALRHADVVAGRIVRLQRQASPVQDRVERYFDRLVGYRRTLDPVPWECDAPHHYTGGANLGFRAEAYRALGGFKPEPCGEDALAIDEASRAGLRVRRHAASIVYTSDRRIGRATGGLAHALQALDTDNVDAAVRSVTVAHPADAAWQYQRHAAARVAFETGDMRTLASQIGLSIDHVTGVACGCPNAEAFAMRLVPTPPGGMRTVPLAVAEAILDDLLGLRVAAFG